MKCGACQMEIEREKVGEHYQSAFHGENLKRKGAGVGPVSEKEWAAISAGVLTRKEGGETPSVVLHSSNTEVTGMHALQHGECLFCGEVVRGLGNPDFADLLYLSHLKTHGFYVVSSAHLVNYVGLMEYLREKILHCMCTYCNKRFSCISKTRAHMESMGHMRYMSSSEYDEFYEYPEQEFGYIIEDGTEMLLPSGKVVEHKKRQKDKEQTRKAEEYYSMLFHPKTTLKRTEVVAKHIPETTTEKLSKMKFAEKLNKTRLRVSKAANNQQHYREDWMQ